MTIVISGGTGLIGQALNQHFINQGKSTLIVSRSPESWKKAHPNQAYCAFDTIANGKAIETKKIEAIIHLSGANIGRFPWTKSYKENILNSRVASTKAWVAWLLQQEHKIPLLNANAIGIYGPQTPRPNSLPQRLDEDSPLGNSSDFLSSVGHAWSKALSPLKKAGKPYAEMRFGIVMSRKGGALPRMACPFYAGVGGVLGSGQQAMSWIALDDLVAAIDFILTKNLTGVYNLTAPKAMTQTDCAHSLAAALHRPCWMRTPAWLLRVMIGEMGQALLLQGQNVYPNKLLTSGFKFVHPDFKSFINKAYS
jgi:uncharacterized protein